MMREYLLKALVVLASLAVPWLAGPVAAAERVALVIGNGRYQHASVLANTGHDAQAVADALTRLGFALEGGQPYRDLTKTQLDQVLKTFGNRARLAEAAVVYYAGHGVESGGKNYLVPVDAELQHEANMALEAVGLDIVLTQIAGTQGWRLVILDACRNNPLAARMARSDGGRSVFRGLERVEPSHQTYVAYAAKHGTQALDQDPSGSGHSPFTAVLLEHLGQPLPLERLFGAVREDVLKRTGNQQEPWLYGAFGREPIYLAGKDMTPEQPMSSPAAQPAATSQQPPTLAEPVARRTNLEDVELITPPTPPFQYHLSVPNQQRAIHQLRLRLVNSTANDITDDDKWFERNDLQLPTYTVPNPFQNIAGNVPSFIPAKFRDQILVNAIRSKDVIILVYGANFGENRYLIAVDSTGKYLYGFDFINYSYAPRYIEEDREYVDQRTVWAFEENNILYVSHSHSTYAKSSMGLNAYITALDKMTGKVLWRTRPLVSNAANFAVIGDTIIAGYGFTAEPDYLYLLNKKTGEVYDQVKLKSGPDYILLKGNRLYVRTYNTDYLFEVDGL